MKTPVAPVNHIGIRFNTLAELDRARATLQALGWEGYQSPEPEHLDRWYFMIPGPDGQPSGLYLELQVFPDAATNVHIEVGVTDPKRALVAFAQFVGFDTVAPAGMYRLGGVLNIHVSPLEAITRIPGK